MKSWKEGTDENLPEHRRISSFIGYVATAPNGRLLMVTEPVWTCSLYLGQLQSRHFGSKAKLPRKSRHAPVFQCSCMLSSVLIGCFIFRILRSFANHDPVVPCKSQVATLAGSSHPLFWRMRSTSHGFCLASSSPGWGMSWGDLKT